MPQPRGAFVCLRLFVLLDVFYKYLVKKNISNKSKFINLTLLKFFFFFFRMTSYGQKYHFLFSIFTCVKPKKKSIFLKIDKTVIYRHSIGEKSKKKLNLV